jgi:hypothetical protein
MLFYFTLSLENLSYFIPKSLDVVFKRIGFAIQKGLAAQLVARLPYMNEICDLYSQKSKK